MAIVVNLRQDPYDVYIGRAGRGHHGYFGNPIVLGKKCSVCGKTHTKAGNTLPCFEIYFLDRIAKDDQFRRRIQALRGMVLGCFCKPRPCHGDIIVRWLEDNPDPDNE